MNRIVASAGALMVGMASVDAANVTGLTPQQMTKWWSVSASLRGFYDDNVYQTPFKQDSPGMEVAPSFTVNLPLERTLITGKYLYLLKYYSERPSDNIDQNHEFDLRLNHRFSERYTLNFEDSFVYSNEPDVIDRQNNTLPGGGVVTTFNRTDATGVRNRANISLEARLTRLVGVRVGYENSFFDYQQDGLGSRSALLDRVEHTGMLEGEWYFTDTTIGFLGYQYGVIEFTSQDDAGNGRAGAARSWRSHYFYVGASHKFNQRLSGDARLGVEYTDSYKLHETDVSPYVDLNGTYTYLPGSNISLGVRVKHAPTDLVGTDPTNPTRNQLASAFYGSWTHRITPKLTGQLFGQYQYSIFNGGEFDGDTEGYFTSALKFTYQFNNNFSADIAYSFDDLVSNLDVSGGVGSTPARGFNRNRVQAGVTVTY